ncbi:hypothetical protein ACEWY4_017658 [Coilia grayii]|uniref:AIG1-type G domain-containing protein n=1 Tax=Coilia grayii TaxID=363190 RepID=A0ABD1JHG5_9TELE
MKMFGEQVWRHTMVLFTCGDMLGDTSIEEHIESEGEPLQWLWLVEKCGNRYHVLGRDDSGKSSQVTELLEKIKEMVAGNSLFSLHEESQTPNTEERTVDATDTTHSDMVKFLDHEWKRMDKDMEETIINVCNDTFKPKGNNSLDRLINLHDDEPPSATSMKESSSRWCTSALSKHQTVSGAEGDAMFSRQAEGDGRETNRSNSSKDIMETLEREWGRREVTVVERFQTVLSDLMEQSKSTLAW